MKIKGHIQEYQQQLTYYINKKIFTLISLRNSNNFYFNVFEQVN